jgi:hypothetical protein
MSMHSFKLQTYEKSEMKQTYDVRKKSRVEIYVKDVLGRLIESTKLETKQVYQQVNVKNFVLFTGH